MSEHWEGPGDSEVDTGKAVGVGPHLLSESPG